jgi:acyl-CoA hydrolase
VRVIALDAHSDNMGSHFVGLQGQNNFCRVAFLVGRESFLMYYTSVKKGFSQLNFH